MTTNKSRRHNRFARLILWSGVILLCASAGYAWKDITQKEFDAAMKTSGDFYKGKEHYSLKVVHTSYRGHESVTPYEQTNGYYRYDHGSYHSFLANVHTIQNKKWRVVIDSVAKSILVGDLVSGKADDVTEVNFKNSMLNVKKFLMCPVGNATRYRLECDDKPMYEAYETELNSSGMMTEMVVYYRKEYPLNPQDQNSPKAKPKLKINWSEYNEKAVFSADEFSTDKYFTELNGKLTLTSVYRNYRLTDVRVKK